MGRKKRSNKKQQLNGGNPAKRPKPESGESYLVKKYRADRNYASMEALVKYTKAHRMLDATYVRWNTGVTSEKPFVFSIRIAGTDLGWGRGKTREAAMDCACRSAFALVNAHGYKNFTVDDDCLAEPPMDLPPPPPPPPPPPGVVPLPPGVPPASAMMMHFPPLPPGLPPPLPPPPVVPAADIIPQPQLAQHVPVATSLAPMASNNNNTVQSTATAAAPVVSLQLSSSSVKPQRKKIKGGLTLVFDAGMEGPDEMCMEEMRASLLRYQKMLPTNKA